MSQVSMGWRAGAACGLVVLLGACGGGGSDPEPPPPPAATYRLGGTVTGLNGPGLVLQLGTGQTLALSADGPFQFDTSLAAGTSYAVSVGSQPVGRTCVVAEASGRMPEADVATIAVSCVVDEPPALTLTTVVPAAGAVGVDRSLAITLGFDRPLDATTVTPESVTLTGPLGNVVPAEVVTDGVTLTVQPRDTLPGDSRYTLTLRNSIAAADGGLLASAVTSDFTTAVQSWSATSTLLSNYPIYSSGLRPEALLALPGRAFAGFFRSPSDGTALDRVRLADGLWSSAQTLHRTAGGAALQSLHAVTVGPGQGAGEARLVWLESQFGGSTAAMTAVYTAGDDRLSTPEPLPVLPGGLVPTALRVAHDEAGGTLVLATAAATLFVYRLDPVTGRWGAAQPLPVGAEPPDEASLSPDRRGGFLALWTVRPATRMPLLMASRLDPATGTWSDAVQVADQLASGEMDKVALAVDAEGRATVAWVHSIGVAGFPEVRAARLDPQSGRWGLPTRLDRSTAGAGDPAIGVDAAGHVTVVWREFMATNAARLDANTMTWSEPRQIGLWSAGTRPVLQVDPVGNAVLLITPDSRLSAIRYRATDDRWSAPIAIDTSGGGTTLFSGEPAAAVNAAGDVAAYWFADVDQGSRQGAVAGNLFR